MVIDLCRIVIGAHRNAAHNPRLIVRGDVESRWQMRRPASGRGEVDRRSNARSARRVPVFANPEFRRSRPLCAGCIGICARDITTRPANSYSRRTRWVRRNSYGTQHEGHVPWNRRTHMLMAAAIPHHDLTQHLSATSTRCLHRSAWLGGAPPLARRAAVRLAASPVAIAGEGGVSHVLPGANATLMDLPPTSPGWFVKPMYLNYDGDASATIPTAAGIVANMHVDVNTFVSAAATASSRRCSGARTTAVAAFLPYSWINVSGDTAALGGKKIESKRVRRRRPDAGAGAAGLEVRRLAVRLPDAGLCADGQLRGRQARQPRTQLLDVRSDRRRSRTTTPSRV